MLDIFGKGFNTMSNILYDLKLFLLRIIHPINYKFEHILKKYKIYIMSDRYGYLPEIYIKRGKKQLYLAIEYKPDGFDFVRYFNFYTFEPSILFPKTKDIQKLLWKAISDWNDYIVPHSFGIDECVKYKERYVVELI